MCVVLLGCRCSGRLIDQNAGAVSCALANGVQPARQCLAGVVDGVPMRGAPHELTMFDDADVSTYENTHTTHNILPPRSPRPEEALDNPLRRHTVAPPPARCTRRRHRLPNGRRRHRRRPSPRRLAGPASRGRGFLHRRRCLRSAVLTPEAWACGGSGPLTPGAAVVLAVAEAWRRCSSCGGRGGRLRPLDWQVEGLGRRGARLPYPDGTVVRGRRQLAPPVPAPVRPRPADGRALVRVAGQPPGRAPSAVSWP